MNEKHGCSLVPWYGPVCSCKGLYAPGIRLFWREGDRQGRKAAERERREKKRCREFTLPRLSGL